MGCMPRLVREARRADNSARRRQRVAKDKEIDDVFLRQLAQFPV
jgi:hypothetical protein